MNEEIDSSANVGISNPLFDSNVNLNYIFSKRIIMHAFEFTI